jgi:metal-sulfur cluster biosynthetic enzyme
MNVITNNSNKCSNALNALRQVKDPEIGLNVVDLGLIYQIDFDDTKKLFIRMTLTTPFCPMGDSITTAVSNTLKSAFPDDEVIVILTHDPPWTRDKISEEGKMFLNY